MSSLCHGQSVNAIETLVDQTGLFFRLSLSLKLRVLFSGRHRVKGSSLAVEELELFVGTEFLYLF